MHALMEEIIHALIHKCIKENTAPQIRKEGMGDPGRVLLSERSYSGLETS